MSPWPPGFTANTEFFAGRHVLDHGVPFFPRELAIFVGVVAVEETLQKCFFALLARDLAVLVRVGGLQKVFEFWELELAVFQSPGDQPEIVENSIADDGRRAVGRVASQRHSTFLVARLQVVAHHAAVTAADDLLASFGVPDSRRAIARQRFAASFPNSADRSRRRARGFLVRSFRRAGESRVRRQELARHRCRSPQPFWPSETRISRVLFPSRS